MIWYWCRMPEGRKQVLEHGYLDLQRFSKLGKTLLKHVSSLFEGESPIF